MVDPTQVVTPVVTPEALVSISSQIAPTAIVEPVQAAPVVQAPVVASVIVDAPVVVPEAVAPIPAIETPKPTDTQPKPAETVIGKEIDKSLQPAPEAPVEPVLKTEGGQSDEPAPPPKYEAFELPEGVSLDDTKANDFTTNLLSKLETEGKVPHEFAQKFGQDLVNLHVNEVKSQIDALHKQQVDAWENQKVQWKDQIVRDPELGGNRLQTTVDSALTFIRTHGGTPEQQTEFRNLMESSGLGNNIVMIRLLASAGRAMSEGRPLTANRPVSAPKSKVHTMYGK